MLLHWQAPSVRCRLGKERVTSPWVPAERSRAWTRASLPDPASRRQEAQASQPSETESRPGTRARSPDAPPTAPQSVSGASLQPSASVRSADSRGAGLPGRGRATGQLVRGKAG